MDPRHLVQLAVILDKGTVTGAAQHLRLTQPTLTRNMATLEMQAGGILFQRSRYGVTSTPLGESLARVGRSISRQMVAADETVSRHKLGLHTHLRLGVGPLIGMALMPQLSDLFLRQNEHIALTVTTGRPPGIVDQLIDGDLDVVIAPAVYANVPPGVNRTLLCEDNISIFCGPSHPLAQLENPSPEQLGECDWMNVGMTSPFQSGELEMLQRSGIRRLRTQFATASDAVILLKMLVRGRHLAVLPRMPLRLLKDEFPFVEITPPAGVTRRDLFLWNRAELEANPALEAIKRCLKALMPVAPGS
ncbi:MAG: LysR family transcriptional regulator [Burkholderiaceae bacterium]